tara:strand:- start:21 stop:695 length:675 start_codon:yes stop_codon:yes gene_type:complete
MNKELTKRFITSIFLISLLALTFLYFYILIITLIIISVISWIEFNALISKIFSNDTFGSKLLRLSIKSISLLYLTTFSFMIFYKITQDTYNLNALYLFSICICSDIGGLIFGKIFKGKKLTKISPNKTISGSIGSFILSLFFVPIFYYFLSEKSNNLFELTLLAIVVSFSCQLGDLFISYLKRKAKVKNTGDLLPGHGGLLDRIDGMLFAIPIGFFAWEFMPIL